nr:hypothetical protein CFP56_71179 [Quercus suber]
MRVRVDLQLDKPLRRGGKIASVEGEKFWVSFRYERLPTFCFHCGRLGHDLKHCQETSNNQSSSNQYGDWLRAQGNSKTGVDKSRSTSSGGKDDSNEDKVEEHIPSTAKNSYTSAMDGRGSTSGTNGSRIEKNHNTKKVKDIIGNRENQPEKALNGWDNSTRLEQVPMHESGARDAASTPPLSLPRSFKNEKEAMDALSLVGQSAQTEKDPMEVNSPLKTNADANGGSTAKVNSFGLIVEKKAKAKVHLKKMAREHNRNKNPQSETELIPVGKKRGGKLVFDEEEEVIVQKRRCTAVNTNQTESAERSAVAAMQHRREP